MPPIVPDNTSNPNTTPQLWSGAGGSTTIEKTDKNICEVNKTYTSDEFMLYLLDIMRFYPQHKWISDHQAQKIIDVLATLKGGMMVSCWDYSENASLTKKLNVQADHFSKVQVTLLILLNYFHKSDVLAKTVDLYVIDDCKNSAKFVHYCMDIQGFLPSVWVYGIIQGLLPSVWVPKSRG